MYLHNNNDNNSQHERLRDVCIYMLYRFIWRFIGHVDISGSVFEYKSCISDLKVNTYAMMHQLFFFFLCHMKRCISLKNVKKDRFVWTFGT